MRVAFFAIAMAGLLWLLLSDMDVVPGPRLLMRARRSGRSGRDIRNELDYRRGKTEVDAEINRVERGTTWNKSQERGFILVLLLGVAALVVMSLMGLFDGWS